MKANRFLSEVEGKLILLFGKYTGKDLNFAAADDPSYLQYLLDEYQSLPDDVVDAIELALAMENR